MDFLLSDCNPNYLVDLPATTMMSAFERINLSNGIKSRGSGLSFGGFEEFMDSVHASSDSSHKYANMTQPTGSSYNCSNQFGIRSQLNGITDLSRNMVRTVRSKILIIFDWDDTLFPTFWLKSRNTKQEERLINQQMKALVVCLKQLFNSLIDFYGSQSIVIVTNASLLWIYEKCASFPPFDGFLSFLKMHSIQIVSAAEKYEQKYPSSPTTWKECAFKDLFKEYFDDAADTQHIVCIGDSFCEYNASDAASKDLRNRVLNRVKLQKNPSINELADQSKNLLASIKQSYKVNL